MRDMNQLELNFDSKPAEPTMRERDAQVEQQLERQRVLTHLNAIKRGHKTWSDLNAPKTEEMVRYCEYLKSNPEDIGSQYSMILIQEMIQRMANKEVKPEVKTLIQCAYQDCY